MPRTARAVEAGLIYHVLNRGNGRMRLFRKDEDFDAFERILAEGLRRYPVQLLTYCLMDNHWHLVVRPGTDRALAQFMGWIGVTHVRRHHQHYHTRGGGHLYQGRYKSFPVQQDDRHFLTVCRYVEANPLRAAMVARATDWRWSGLSARSSTSSTSSSSSSGGGGGGRRGTGKPLKLSAWPVDRPAGWVDVLERSLKPDELQRLRTSVNRGRPFGNDDWTRRAAARLGLQFTLRNPGRPKRGQSKNK